MKKSFSDKLTPGQIQQVLDALGLDWRPLYDPKNDGWVNLYAEGYSFNSDLSVNIFHGGFVDQYSAGHPEPEIDGIPIRGDLVTLVAWLKYESRDPLKGIEWIQEVCGINRGVKPPDVKEGYEFANAYLAKENGNTFVRIPTPIMQSKLSSTQKIVWGAIFSRCGKEQIYSFPGIRRIADDAGLAKSTVQEAIQELKYCNLLIEKYRGTNKAPARFPLVADANIINKKVQQRKIGVPGISTGVSGITDRAVPGISTELDSYNYNQLKDTKANKGEPGKAPASTLYFLPDGFFSDSYFLLFHHTYKRSQLEFDTCLFLGISAESLMNGHQPTIN
jgi:hypothetical protein